MIDLPEWYILLSAVIALSVAANIHGFTLYEAVTHPRDFAQAILSAESPYISTSHFSQLNLIPPELQGFLNLFLTIFIAIISFVAALLIGILLKRVALLVARVTEKIKLPRSRRRS